MASIQTGAINLIATNETVREVSNFHGKSFLEGFDLRDKRIVRQTTNENSTVTIGSTAKQTFTIARKDSIILGNSVVFIGTITATNTGNNPAILPFSLESCIKQVVTRHGTKQVDNIIDYAQTVIPFQMIKYSYGWSQTTGKLLARCSLTESDNQGTNSVTHRAVHVMPEFSILGGVPFFDMSYNDFTVEVTFKDAANECTTADTGTTTVTIANFDMYYNEVVGNTAAFVRRNITPVNVCTGLDQLQGSIASGGTTYNLNHTNSKSMIKSIVSRMFLDASLTSQDLFTKYTHSAFNATTAFQYKIDGEFYYAGDQILTDGTEIIYDLYNAYRFADADAGQTVSSIHNSAYERESFIDAGFTDTIAKGWAMPCTLEFDSSSVSGLKNMKSIIFSWKGTASAATTMYHEIYFTRIYNQKNQTLIE